MDIIREYRCRGENKLAYDLAIEEYRKRRQETPDGFLIKTSDIDTLNQLYQELTIVAWYVNQNEEAKNYYDEAWLVFGRKFTDNLAFYVDKLATTMMMRCSNGVKKPHVNDIPTNPECYSCNPSIVQYGKGYLISLRLVNYRQIDGLYYYHEPDTIIRSKNMLLYMSENFHVEKTYLCIEQPNTRPINLASPWQGSEDVRLYWANDGRLSFSASIGDTPTGKIHMALGQFDSIRQELNLNQGLGPDGLPEGDVLYYQLTPLNSPFGAHCEKNWCHVSDQTFIYSYHPFLCWDVSTSTFEYLDSAGLNLIDFRGSTSPIPFDQGYLLVVHSHLDNGFVKGRTYIHRFLWLNEDKKLKKLSWWFFLREQGVEFVTGLTLTHNNLNVMFTFGFRNMNIGSL